MTELESAQTKLGFAEERYKASSARCDAAIEQVTMLTISNNDLKEVIKTLKVVIEGHKSLFKGDGS